MKKLPQANKQLGQHFLRDQTVIQNIARLPEQEFDFLIEIGPGPCILTPYLANWPTDYYLIEMDERFEELLVEEVPRDRIFFQDALEFDWKNFFKEHGYKKGALVSNLPYNVSTPLIIQFLQIPELKHLVLMMQKEVGRKILPLDGSNKISNSLSCLCQNYFEINQRCLVAPGCFVPPPKVDSIVLEFNRIEDPEVSTSDFKGFESFLRTDYQFKRKQLGGILKKKYGADKALEFLEKAGIKETVRCETLNLQQVTLLYKTIVSNK